MAGDFLPYSDHAFRSWARQFMGQLLAAPAEFGVGMEEAQRIAEGERRWEAALDEHLQAQAAAKGAVAVKDDARRDVERLIRGAVRRIQAAARVTDKHRELLGITVPAAKGSGVVTEILTWPEGELDVSEKLAHTIRFWDSGYGKAGRGGKGKKRPAGVVGCELWSQLDVETVKEAAAGLGDFKLDGISLGFSHRMIFTKAAVGKLITYQMRWVMRRGVKGKWGPVFSGVVVG